MTHPPALERQDFTTAADGKPADAFGALDSAYHNEYFLRTTINFIASVPIGGGGFLCMFSIFEMSRKEFSSVVWLAAAVGIAAIALGMTIVRWNRRIALRKQTYRLYKHGIRISGPEFQYAALYRDIEDIVYFNRGGCAFRTTPTAPWVVIDGRIRDAGSLTYDLRYLHRKQRGATLIAQLHAGVTMTFRYMDDVTARRVSRGAAYLTVFRTSELTLDEHHLNIGQKVVDIGHIGEPSLNRWTNNMTVTSKKDGSDFHKMHARAILSGEVLQFMITDMQKRRRKAARWQ